MPGLDILVQQSFISYIKEILRYWANRIPNFCNGLTRIDSINKLAKFLFSLLLQLTLLLLFF